MSRIRSADAPNATAWTLAVLAIAAAGTCIYGMAVFAQAATHDQTLVNWFGLTTAVGGAVAFELIKYALTVKARHVSGLADQIILTPARREELGALMSEISRRRELYTGLTVAIELRARELAAEREHAELVQRASTIQDEAQELAEKQRRLALDRESVAAGELGKEMQEILKKLEPSRLDTLVPRLGGGVGAMGGGTVATLVEAIADYAVSEWRRLKARRARRQAGAAEAQLSDRDSRDERSGSDDS